MRVRTHSFSRDVRFLLAAAGGGGGRSIFSIFLASIRVSAPRFQDLTCSRGPSGGGDDDDDDMRLSLCYTEIKMMMFLMIGNSILTGTVILLAVAHGRALHDRVVQVDVRGRLVLC